MPSIHAIRWIRNLEGSDHQLYWYDILNKGRLDVPENVIQLLGKSKRKIPYFRGEYYLSKKNPKFYNLIRPLLQATENEILDGIIKIIKPDVIHSFEMQSCSYPILKSMNKLKDIPWIYSSWGSDLFYYKNLSEHNQKIKDVLRRVDFLQADCKRDLEIAAKLGFIGKDLPIIPGGTGYKVEELERLQRPIGSRKIILVKGYEHNFGRALNVMKALKKILPYLLEYEIIIFGAHLSVVNYITNNKLPFEVFDRNQLTQNELLDLMGKALIYLGNSISDGMPNTLLEAVVMGAFPIQSNPGNVTSEIINNGKNGLLIQDPENIDDIASLILVAINNKEMLRNAQQLNKLIAFKRLNFEDNKQKVLAIYDNIEKKLECE